LPCSYLCFLFSMQNKIMKSFFQQFTILSATELDQLDPFIINKRLKKGDFLIQEGKICDEVVFIKTGILRSFYYSDKAEEITYCLTFPGNVMTAFSSFITGNPTEETIQALTDAELVIIKKENLEKLYQKGSAWLKLGKHLSELQYIALENRIFGYQKYSAKKRYEELLAKQAEFIQNVPIQYLASYLNITPRHLSRLRREISQKAF